MLEQIYRAKRTWLRWVVYSCLILVLLALAFFSFSVYQLYARPMISSPHEPVRIQVGPSASAASFARSLEERNLISSRRLFLALIRLKGDAHHLKAGIYELKAEESAEHFLSRVVAGDVIINLFQIIEGTTEAIVARHLAATDGLYYQPSDWLDIAGDHSSAEGLLLADTYQYVAGNTSKNLLDRAHRQLMTYLESVWQQRDPDLPYKTSYELLTAASILEKEAAIPREKRIISGVIINRLRLHMPLQMDPTVIYAMGDSYKGHLTREDLLLDSPFNTYRHRGLPPTPIAMVGKDAIDAAAHPELSPYLYYVATGDGSHYFSSSYEQQRKAVARYRGKNDAK